MKPVVAIVGRPNVGKSTLFNRIVGGLQAIVENVPGVTRDRLYRDAVWLDREFTLIDTGGIDFYGPDGTIESKVKEQALLAVEEADVLIFTVDSHAGVTADDEEVAQLLHKSGKPVVLAVSKVEDFSDPSLLFEYYGLGLGEPIPVSGAHGMNIGDLLDAVVAHFPPKEAEEEGNDAIRIAVIGRPNVGKSSLVNKLLGQERVIVSDVAGTTRDAIDSYLERDGREYVLIDTAGMRKRKRVVEPTERYSVARSLRAIDHCDVVLMLLDAASGITEQDKKIAGYAHEAGRGMLIVVNKWDLPEKDGKSMHQFDEKIREELSFLDYAPTLYVSALTGQRVAKILPLVDFIAEQQNTRVPTARLNEVLREATLLNLPPTDKGRRLKLYYMTQVGIKPPKFILFVNDTELLHFSYERYLINQLRQNFSFAGTPIWLSAREKEDGDKD